MTVTIEIPPPAERVLRDAFGEGLSRAALEALAAEGYRTGKLSRFAVQKLLGFDNRWDAEQWLGARGLHIQYSMTDLDADRETLERILGPVKP